MGCGKASLPAMNIDASGSVRSKAGPRNICDSRGSAMLSGPKSDATVVAAPPPGKKLGSIKDA